jgi:hypothetical protein
MGMACLLKRKWVEMITQKLLLELLRDNAHWEDWEEMFDTKIIRARWWIRYFKPWGKRFIPKRAMVAFKYPSMKNFKRENHDLQKEIMLKKLFKFISVGLRNDQMILFRPKERVDVGGMFAIESAKL